MRNVNHVFRAKNLRPDSNPCRWNRSTSRGLRHSRSLWRLRRSKQGGKKKRAFNGHSALGPMCDAEKDWYERSLWRPVLVKIAIIKLPHRSVFSATVVLFISLLCIFMRRLLITFSNVNYFNVSLVKFFIGSTNEFSYSYCNLFLIVLRIIFYFWYRELFFHWRWELFFTGSWIYFLAYNTLQACDWGGLGGCLTFG